MRRALHESWVGRDPAEREADLVDEADVAAYDPAPVLQVLAFVIPFGLAGAISPVMLIEETVILAGPDGKRAGTRYPAGAALTLLLFVSVLVLFGRSIALPQEPHLDATLDIVIGALLVVFAVAIHWRRPPQQTAHRARPEMSPREALGFGVFSMATNFTTLALVVPAAKEIASSNLDLGGRAFVIAVLVVLASTPAWLPVALTALAPGAALRGLVAFGDLIERRGRLLTVLVLAGLGTVLVVRGILRLLGA
jgi:threonine/homoserine/homoserine lactone efflux protein